MLATRSRFESSSFDYNDSQVLAASQEGVPV